MTKYIAIEGGDGVGKNTISTLLERKIRSLGFSVSRVDFPQYGSTLAGRALGDFLSGRYSGVTPRTAAALYALDRFESMQLHNWAESQEDFIVFDRYIGSNIAYQTAKVPFEHRKELEDWIINLECSVYGLPHPDVSILLRLPHNNAKELIGRKASRSYTDRVYDLHEDDDALQNSLRDTYDDLAKRNSLGKWASVNIQEGGVLKAPELICQEALDIITSLI